jgi:predicted dehydrogenase
MYMKELLESGYVGEVVSINVGGFRTGHSDLPSARSWQADAALGANTLTIAFGHVVDALRFVAGDFARVRSLVAVQTPQWYETDTGRTVEVTSPDNVLVSGKLVIGAVVSVQVASVPWAGSGFRMEIYGREGTLAVTGSVSSQRGETLRLRGARGMNELADLELPDRYFFVPYDFPRGDAFNVGQMYSLFADSIRAGQSRTPTFETAVGLHRFLDSVKQSSDSGYEVSLV